MRACVWYSLLYQIFYLLWIIKNYGTYTQIRSAAWYNRAIVHDRQAFESGQRLSAYNNHTHAQRA